MNDKLEALSQQLGRRAPMAEQIAESIRNMIVAGDLKPGERIVESRIAREIGVGQPTVREALVALEHQGLVARKANQGCVVTSLTRAEICQLIRVRAELETLAVELAVETATDDEIAELLKVTDRMKEAAAERDPPQRFFGHDLKFHQTLLESLAQQLSAASAGAGAGAALGLSVHSQPAPQSGYRHDGIGASPCGHGGGDCDAR